jgi:hypothetical protein
LENTIRHRVEGLEGKFIFQNAGAGKIAAQFNKTVLVKVLSERTQLNVKIDALASGESSFDFDIEAYPQEAVGQKLMFGARKGVTRTILD